MPPGKDANLAGEDAAGEDANLFRKETAAGKPPPTPGKPGAKPRSNPAKLRSNRRQPRPRLGRTPTFPGGNRRETPVKPR